MRCRSFRTASPRSIDLYCAQKAARVARIANVRQFGSGSQRLQIAAGIDQRIWHGVLAQHIDGAIDGKSFGDAAKVDTDSGMPKAYVAVGEQFDGFRYLRFGRDERETADRRRKQTHALQVRGDGDVKGAV